MHVFVKVRVPSAYDKCQAYIRAPLRFIDLPKKPKENVSVISSADWQSGWTAVYASPAKVYPAKLAAQWCGVPRQPRLFRECGGLKCIYSFTLAVPSKVFGGRHFDNSQDAVHRSKRPCRG